MVRLITSLCWSACISSSTHSCYSNELSLRYHLWIRGRALYVPCFWCPTQKPQQRDVHFTTEAIPQIDMFSAYRYVSRMLTGGLMAEAETNCHLKGCRCITIRHTLTVTPRKLISRVMMLEACDLLINGWRNCHHLPVTGKATKFDNWLKLNPDWWNSCHTSEKVSRRNSHEILIY